MPQTTIYYFSATGNSLKVAKDLADKIGDCQIISIVDAVNKKEFVPNTSCVGFVFPLYYFSMPKLVNEFIKQIDLSKTTYLFGISTPGGTKIGGIHRLKKLLSQRGYKLKAGFYVMMPDNFILMLKIASREKQKTMFNNSKKKISSIAEMINKKENYVEGNYILDRLSYLGEMIWNIGFFKRDKHFHVNEECNGCGICEKICPVNNITLVESRPAWNHKCENCLACIHACPCNAIHWKKSTLTKGQYRHPDIQLQELIIEK
jgi:ferredoxin/flavodoxin